MSTTARMAKPASMANFCWRDHDESSVAVNVLLFDLGADFETADILSPPCARRSCNGGKQGGCQWLHVDSVGLLTLLASRGVQRRIRRVRGDTAARDRAIRPDSRADKQTGR